MSFGIGGDIKAIKRGAAPKKVRKVTVPYAPTPTGAKAEREARGHVTAPYAPTRTGKTAEHAAQTKRVRRQAAQSLRATRKLLHKEVKQPQPFFKAPTEQRGGISPSSLLHAVENLGGSPVGSNPNPVRDEVVKEAKNLAQVAKENYEGAKGIKPLVRVPTSKETRAALALTTPTLGDEATASNAVQGATDAAKAATKAKVADIKAIPQRIKTAPERAAKSVKGAPTKIRRAATTKEGRVDVAKGAAKAAKKHPVRTGYAGAVVLPEGALPGDVTKRARAAAVGTADALLHHPGETLKTTARQLPAAITGPAALGEAAGLSLVHGDPTYLEKTAKEQAKGVEKIAADTFSGDPKLAEQAARKEGSLAFLTPLPAISRLKSYERARGGLREAVGDVRRSAASKLGDKANRNIRHSPKGTQPHIFKKLANRDYRKQVAILKQRIDNPARVANAKHEENILRSVSKLEKKHKGSHETLQVLAEYGIRDAKTAALVREKGPGDAQLIKALDYAEAHPDLFKDKSFHALIKALRDNERTLPATVAGKGERARLMQQGDVLGIQRPEAAVPHAARGPTSATTREGAWKDLAERDKRLEALKKEAKTPRRKAEAKALEDQHKALYDALDKFTRPEHSPDTSTRLPYDDKLLKEYKDNVEKGRKEAGFDNAIYTAHTPASGDKGSGLVPNYGARMGNLEHMRMGSDAAADNLDRTLEGLVRGTVHGPRLKAASKEFGRQLAERGKLPFTLDGKKQFLIEDSKDWQKITSPKTKENPDGGQYDPKTVGRLPLAEIKRAIDDPFLTDSQREGQLNTLLKDAEEGRVPGSAPSLLLPREMIKEARAQINPEHGDLIKALNVFGRVANRSILGTNPAWAIAQIPAEGIPALLAKPSLLNPIKTSRLVYDISRRRKTDPDAARAIEATAGAAPISSNALRTPLDMQETYTPALWEKGAKAMTRGKTAKAALDFVNLRALGKFDAHRQNIYREALYLAEGDKRFRSWHSSLTGMFDKEAQLSKRFKTRDELQTWLKNTKEGKKADQQLQDYVDNVAGNWTSFTRFEREFAPAAIFYGFIRYSLRWPLWAFPKEHPITATIANLLGQANSNQIEKLLGGPPTSPIPYAYPVYSGPKGKAVLPAGSRISPGQSSLTQALQSGNPGQIISSANPILAAANEALGGPEPLTGEAPRQARGYAALEQLLSMPAPVRLPIPKGVPVVGGSSLEDRALKALGGPDQSAASKAFERFDPNKGLRSFVMPTIPLSAGRFKEEEKLGKAFSTKYGEGKVPYYGDSPLYQKIAYGKNAQAGNVKAVERELAAAEKKIHAQESASNLTKKAEEPFYPKEKKAPEAIQKLIQERFENAYKTGPNGESKKKGNPYLEALGSESSGGNPYLKAIEGGSSKGNPYLEALK